MIHPYFSIMNNPPLTPDDFTDEQKRLPALVNDEARNFFNGVFTVSFVYYRVVYRNSGDATDDNRTPGVVVADPLTPSSFVAPTYETFQAVQTANVECLQNFREPDLETRLGVYTLFDEMLVEALLTWDFRNSLDPVNLPTDANLTATPYYWDFLVRQPATGSSQWKDVFIAIDFDVDGTGLVKIEPYQSTLPPGNLLEADNVIDADTGGDAFEKILLENNLNALNFDGSEYAGGVTADQNKRASTVETPEPAPSPTCPMDYSYNSATGLCEHDLDPSLTETPTCPDGWRFDSTQKACVRQ